MRLPAPSTPLLMALPQIYHLEPPHLHLVRPPGTFLPFDPNLITPVPASHTPSDVVIPPYDPLRHSTPSSYARLFDEVAYGDSPTLIDESTTRFVLNNPNGVTRDGSYDHLSEYLLDLLEIGVDVIQLPEANVDWRRPREFKKCQTAVQSVFRHSKLSTSSSIKCTTSTKLPGGTLTIAVDNFTGRISSSGRDSKYGRWSYFLTRGRNGRTIVVVTIYQVCNQPVSSSGSTTACLQQHTLLDEAGRISVNSRGVPVPHPRKALLQDFADQLRSWRSAGHELIISGDLNELLGDNPEEFGRITTEFDLADVYRHRHGMDEPATFHLGHRRLDYILCSVLLLPTVTACGILPFHILSASDHRTVFVDFDTKLLFGSLPSELASCNDPQFKSRDYESSEHYVLAMHTYCHENNVYRMAEAAAETANAPALNRLDDAVGHAMNAGLQAVKKRYRTPFSPEMRQTRLLRSFYNLHMSQFKTGRKKSKSISEVQRKLQSLPPPPSDQQECHLLLKDVQNKIRKLRKEAAQKRRDFLTGRVAFECDGDEEKAERIRTMIQKAEDLRAVCKKIRHVVKPGHSSGLQTVLVPVDHDDPKKATVWKTIDDPTQVVAVLQARNQKHFRQAEGTPFTTGELAKIPFDGSGPVAESVLDGTYKSSDPVVQMLLDELVRPDHNALPPIEDLLTAVAERFKTWDETTSVSPFSKRYLTQYISLIRIIRFPSKNQDAPTNRSPDAEALASVAKEILQLHVNLLQLAIQHKHSYSRWQRVANLMLEKDHGIPKIHRLRIIHLYEADLNLLMGIYFARSLVRHIESSNSFNAGCYGNRAGLSAHEPVFVEELQNTICYLSRTNRLDQDNDATACYDRIPPNLANLVARSNGMDPSLCEIHGATLENMSYHLLTALGISEEAYRNEKDSAVYGTGQGSTYSPPTWAQIVSKLFDAHGKRAHGATYCSPDGSISIFLHMLGFVDDTKHHVNDMMSPSALSVETLVSMMAQDSQLWSDLLTASGAALELSKMYFYICSWKFESSGKPFLDDTIQTTIPVKSADRKSTVHVPNRSVNSARRTLGPIKCPGRNQSAQFKALLNTSDEFARTIQSSALSKREALTAYFSFYLPKMCYVLNTSFLTEAQLTVIQKKATSALFRKSGFNQHTAIAVKFGPPRLGGIGFRSLYTEQSLLITCMVLKHLRIPGQAHTLIRIALAWAQLASGVGFPILQYPDQEIPTIEDPFTTGIRSGLTHLNASIRLHDSMIRPLSRWGDFYIMERIQAFGNFSTQDSLRVNYCRLYLGAYLASDIVSPDGRTIQHSVFKGTLTQRPNTPSMKFPRQARPDKSSWVQWRRALRFLFTAPRCTDLRLLVPLGSWHPLRPDSPKWRYYRSADSLVVRSRFTDVITRYPPDRRGRRSQSYLKHRGIRISSLPSDSVPIDHPTEDRRQYVTGSDEGLNFTHATSVPTTPQSFHDFVSQLDPALRALVADVELVRPIAEIAQLLSTTTTLTLVGDGGAKSCRGSFGAVASLDAVRILRVKGPVSGPDPRSYRAEAHAMAAIILCVVLIHRVVPHHHASHYHTLEVYSDNQGLVDTIHEMKEWETLYPSNALASEWDILSVILNFIPKLPVKPAVKHVKGHQDKEAPVSTLPLPAQLNCEADSLATEALIAILAPIPQCLVFPSAVCQLDVSMETVTRKVQSSLRFSAMSPPLTQYLKDRNDWDDETYSSVCWPAFSSARFSTANSSFVPKYSHRHLPVGEKANRNDSKYSPSCPACSAPLETNEHFLLCAAPSRVKWRQTFLSSLESELTRLYTDPMMITFLKETIDRLLDGKIISCTGTFRDIAVSQNRIGWMSLFRGFWSQKWLDAHLAHVREVPLRDQTAQESRSKHQDRWLNTVSRFVMKKCHQLWKIRNNERHGVTPAEKAIALRVTAERELAAIYARREECEPRHRNLFLMSLGEHNRQSLSEIRNWISMHSSIIRISCQRHLEAQIAGT